MVAFDSDPHAASAIDDLDRLQADMPSMLSGSGLSGARVSYAGDTPLAAETVDRLKGDSGRIAAVVILANLVLLMIFLRSVVAPLLLVGASLLAVAATLGIAVWILQVQLGEDCLTYFVPFATGVLLVSLGSDYNVFVTGSVWREAERRPLADAIALAAPRASRAIRAAGLTLAASFALLAIVPVLAFREFALIMAVGVLVETFVVRSLLVPALPKSMAARESSWSACSTNGYYFFKNSGEWFATSLQQHKGEWFARYQRRGSPLRPDHGRVS